MQSRRFTGQPAPTFAQQLAELRPALNRTLFTRAALASSLAKVSRRPTRERLYAIKHQALCVLIERGNVIVGHDQDRYPGLLSVAISPSSRLHTHEGWLRAASRDVRTL